MVKFILVDNATLQNCHKIPSILLDKLQQVLVYTTLIFKIVLYSNPITPLSVFTFLIEIYFLLDR